MRPLDWRGLLDEHRIPFIERGANVKRGEVNIRCPFCGSADPSQHMGLNLDTGWYSCWRNRRAHSGKSPLRLLMALLHVPYWKAREIAGLGEDFVDPDGFTALAARVLGRQKTEEGQTHQVSRFLAFPREFEPLLGRRARRHLDYLDGRGFAFPEDLAETHGLRFASTGDWRDRVILPYEIDRDLVAWTGRAIARSTIRYRDLSRDECLVPPKETLFNYDCIALGGRVLIIVEGPLDALKIDHYGAEVGVRAVALSTNSVSDEQAYMLEEAEDQFDYKFVMMDMASGLGLVDSMRMRQELAFIRDLRITRVPYGLKDAGEMSPKQAIRWTDAIADNPQDPP
jgi:hypothetical protein